MPPGCGGALRPEKRVTARSKLPQKKCTGLALPMKPVRNCANTPGRREHAPEPVGVVAVVGGVHAVPVERDRVGDLARQLIDAHRDADSAERRHHLGIEFGDRHRPQHHLAELPVAVRTHSTWSMKSKSSWNARPSNGIGEVVSPRAVT